MRWVTGRCLRARFHVVGLAAVLMAVGLWQLRGIRVAVFPAFMPAYVEVQTEALGLSAEEVEQFITVPLEADLLNGVAWLRTIRSESVPGLSSIQLVFEPGTDVMRARQMVQERLTQALDALPKVSRPPTMLQPLSSMNRVMMIGLSSKGSLSLIDVSVLARWTIRPRLMGVPGVANVSIWGQRERQLQVQVLPERLRDRDVSLADVIATAGNALWVSPLTFLNASTPGTGGFIDTPNQRLEVRHVSPIVTPADLAQVPIKTRKGKALRLGDVAEVVEDHQPLIGDALVDHQPGLLLVVEKFPWANTRDVTRGLDVALQALQPGLTGVTIDASIFRPATFLEAAIRNLVLALGLGGALLVLALGVSFRGWRAALVSVAAVALALVVAGLVLSLRGVTVNVMVLTGLVVALGAIVDDAVIDVENMRRRLCERRQGSRRGSPAAVVLEASLEMRRPMLYAMLIMALALVPVFLVERLSGDGVAAAFLLPLALSYGLAALASMLVALTVTPALGLILLPPDSRMPRRDVPLARWLRRGYEGSLARVIRAPRVALVVALVLAAVAVAALPSAGPSLVPPFKETDVLIHWDGKPGTSLPEMRRITGQVTRELRSIKGVRNVGAHVGRAVMSDQVVGINAALLWVSLDPASDHDATVAAIQGVVDDYPGFHRDVRTHSRMRMNMLLARPRDRVVVRVYGDDLAVLRGQAEEVRRALSGLGGVADLRVERQVDEPTVEIKVDLAAARRHGVKPGDVRRAAATLVTGIEVGSLFEEQKVFEVVVLGGPETRRSLSSIGDLLVDTPDGGHVRLREVADLRIAPNPVVIKRDAVSRYVDVEAIVRGRAHAAVARDAQRRLDGIRFPLGYRAEVVGGYAERQAAPVRMAGFAVAAMVGMYLLLQAGFGSWRLAALGFLTLPAALVGGVLAAFARGDVISLASLAGFVMVTGLAVRQGIALIDHYRRLERETGERPDAALILRGAGERVLPIVMTAVATGLALTPLALSGRLPGLEIGQPMAVVVLGGLITATLFNLFVVPALYLRLVSRRRLAMEPTP